MSGTKAGAKISVAKILAKNPNHFRDIGAIGGKNSNTGGFAHFRPGETLAQHHRRVGNAGRKGGTISRRKPADGK